MSLYSLYLFPYSLFSILFRLFFFAISFFLFLFAIFFIFPSLLIEITEAKQHFTVYYINTIYSSQSEVELNTCGVLKSCNELDLRISGTAATRKSACSYKSIA